jgi:transposase InsO family protein
MRRYIVTFIDPVSHFAFAVGLPSKHARYTARALEQGLSLLPQRPTTVLSDNGSEFEADFAQLLVERGIKRWYTYPKTPKMNAHAERFNRTIQESFVDYHEELVFTDLALFNRKARRLAGLLQRRAPAPLPRPAFPATLPPATSTRVPKVLDSYNNLTGTIG